MEGGAPVPFVGTRWLSDYAAEMKPEEAKEKRMAKDLGPLAALAALMRRR